jgi:hypothetical protein
MLNVKLVRLYCGQASTAVSTGILYISGDEVAKNKLVCLINLWFLW